VRSRRDGLQDDVVAERPELAHEPLGLLLAGVVLPSRLGDTMGEASERARATSQVICLVLDPDGVPHERRPDAALVGDASGPARPSARQ
jgi:hypothetical protein